VSDDDLLRDLIAAGVDAALVARVARVIAIAEQAPIRSKHAEAQARYRSKQRSRVITRDHRDHAVPDTSLSYLLTSSYEEESKKKEERVERVERGGVGERVSARKTRLPTPWTLPDEYREWALSDGFSLQDVDQQACRFHDHHSAKGTVFVDWLAAFRNWMRRSRDWGQHQRTGGQTNDRSATAAIDRLRRKLNENQSGLDFGPFANGYFSLPKG
jgi:hypothetical protein